MSSMGRYSKPPFQMVVMTWEIYIMSSIIQCFETIVRKNPNKTAVVLRDQQLSFQQLASYAKRVGYAIGRLNISKIPIGVFTDRTIAPLIGFIGVLYSNSFYVPIDIEMPLGKISHIIEDASISVILCGKEGDDILRAINYNGTIIHYEDLPSNECKIPTDKDFDFLYMVYTSGSTGNPKGILKTQSAEINFIDAFWERIGFNENDIIGNQTPFFFDASAKDLYLMICRGITLVIIPTELFALPPELIDYLNEKQITVASWVPTVISLVAQLNPFSMFKPTTLRKVLFVGEVMPMKHLNVWRKELPNITYINLYGQSEIAGICLYYEVEGQYDNSYMLPMGKALDNCEIYLVDLDSDSIVTEVNHLGEIYVVSNALADCYWNDEEKTKNSFIFRDFGNGPVRCFRTGDMAKFDSDGNLLFVERKDNQIKHMGYRIELNEIETVACSLPDIDRCCCLYNYDKRKIILFCQLIANSLKTGKEIRSELKPILSSYFLPGKVVIKDKLPLNRNGKIDRQALKKEL